jgi:Fe-S-cluster-containing hydrogenase component 2
MDICPFGSISVDPVEDKVIKCDLCGEDPLCAQVCPTGALSFISTETFSLEERLMDLRIHSQLRKRLEKPAKIVKARVKGGKSND